MKKRWFLIAVLAGIGWMLLEGTPATATTLRALTLTQLGDRSDAVVLGRAVSQGAEWRGSRIYTLSQFVVEDVLAGDAPARLTVVQIGGVVRNHAMPVPGVAELRPGADVVLFLRRIPGRDGEYEISGMSQGMLRPVDGKVLVWAPSAALWDGERLHHPTRREVSWRELRRAVRGAK